MNTLSLGRLTHLTHASPLSVHISVASLSTLSCFLSPTCTGQVYHAGPLPEGSKEGNSFIVMDYLNFGPRGDQAEFGRQLALMHAVGRCRLTPGSPCLV